jgi:hypothetical protein
MIELRQSDPNQSNRTMLYTQSCTSIIMVIISYERRTMGVHVGNVNTKRAQSNTLRASKTGGYNDRGNTTRGVARKAQMRRCEVQIINNMSFCLDHHTILNMLKSRRKNPFFFFFFVEGGALWVRRDDDR